MELDPRRLGDERYLRIVIAAALGNYLDSVQADLPHTSQFQDLVGVLRYLANMTGVHWAAVLQSGLMAELVVREEEEASE